MLDELGRRKKDSLATDCTDDIEFQKDHYVSNLCHSLANFNPIRVIRAIRGKKYKLKFVAQLSKHTCTISLSLAADLLD